MPHQRLQSFDLIPGEEKLPKAADHTLIVRQMCCMRDKQSFVMKEKSCTGVRKTGNKCVGLLNIMMTLSVKSLSYVSNRHCLAQVMFFEHFTMPSSGRA